MPLKPAYFWEATVELELSNLAFSLQTADEGRGATKKRIFSADWLNDGKIMFNPAQRLAGWLRKQLPLVRSSYQDQVQALKVFPFEGNLWTPIADIKDLTGADKPPEDSFELPEGLPYPLKQFIVVRDARGGQRVTTTYWYVLAKPVTVKVKIISFARGITADMVKEALSKLGRATGLGDKHSVGHGTFIIKSFEAKEERLNL